jgi:cation-transporting P-type ATPase F
MQTLLSKPWHHLPADEAVTLLESDRQNGLDGSPSSIAKSTSVPNQLTPRQGKSPLIKFLLQFKNPLSLILLAASAITAVLKDPLDAVVIFGVVLINAILGSVQQAQAERAIAALARPLPAEAFVPTPHA